LLVRRLVGPSQNRGRARHISPSEFQARKKYLMDDISINHSLVLPSEVEALSRVLLSGIQFIPFIEHTGETKMHFANKLKRLIARHL
jgi:hypothetical protein